MQALRIIQEDNLIVSSTDFWISSSTECVITGTDRLYLTKESDCPMAVVFIHVKRCYPARKVSLVGVFPLSQHTAKKIISSLEDAAKRSQQLNLFRIE